MTALDDALTAYRRACDDARRIETLRHSYRAATAEQVEAARAERRAAREALDRAVEAGEGR